MAAQEQDISIIQTQHRFLAHKLLQKFETLEPDDFDVSTFIELQSESFKLRQQFDKAITTHLQQFPD